MSSVISEWLFYGTASDIIHGACETSIAIFLSLTSFSLPSAVMCLRRLFACFICTSLSGRKPHYSVGCVQFRVSSLLHESAFVLVSHWVRLRYSPTFCMSDADYGSKQLFNKLQFSTPCVNRWTKMPLLRRSKCESSGGLSLPSSSGNSFLRWGTRCNRSAYSADTFLVCFPVRLITRVLVLVLQ